jgi:signal transduction histidine kinase
MVQISIKDTGIGVPPEDQEHLFERFFRASNVQQLDTSGVGLGLYIVKMLVELQGGTIWFDSMVGQGTTFYVNLPVAA